MSIGGMTPGWLIGFLTREDDSTCEYCTLNVVSLVANSDGTIEPIVMLPDGQTMRAIDVGLERAFAVGPDEDLDKVARAHAATRARVVRSVAA